MNFEEFLVEAAASHSDHAAKIRAAADHQHEEDKRTHAGDAEGLKFAKASHKDLHKLADHVASGDYKKAYTHMRNMNTTAKETVPKSQFHHIDKRGNK